MPYLSGEVVYSLLLITPRRKSNLQKNGKHPIDRPLFVGDSVEQPFHYGGSVMTESSDGTSIAYCGDADAWCCRLRAQCYKEK